MESKPIVLDTSEDKCYLIYNKEQDIHIAWRVVGSYLRFIHLHQGSLEDEEPLPDSTGMSTLTEETHQVLPITLDKYLCLRNLYCTANKP